MPTRHLRQGTSRSFQNGEDSISTGRLERIIKDFIRCSKSAGHSPKTIATREIFLKNLIWFLKTRGFDECDTGAMRDFMAYVCDADPLGKWGVRFPGGKPRFTKPSSPATRYSYYNHICTFFKWAVEEGEVEVSPMQRVQKPPYKTPQVQPLNLKQVNSVLDAARRSVYSARDTALVSLLIDTGMRAAEVCGIQLRDIDFENRHITTIGKGEKRRTVYFTRATERAIYNYLRQRHMKSTRKAVLPESQQNAFLFVSEAGIKPGEKLTPNGLLHIIRRLGENASIQGGLYPHRLRHTFAYMMVCSGATEKSVQELLGHEDRTMTHRYIKLGEADIERQHDMHSPMNNVSA